MALGLARQQHAYQGQQGRIRPYKNGQTTYTFPSPQRVHWPRLKLYHALAKHFHQLITDHMGLVKMDEIPLLKSPFSLPEAQRTES